MNAADTYRKAQAHLDLLAIEGARVQYGKSEENVALIVELTNAIRELIFAERTAVQSLDEALEHCRCQDEKLQKLQAPIDEAEEIKRLRSELAEAEILNRNQRVTITGQAATIESQRLQLTELRVTVGELESEVARLRKVIEDEAVKEIGKRIDVDMSVALTQADFDRDRKLDQEAAELPEPTDPRSPIPDPVPKPQTPNPNPSPNLKQGPNETQRREHNTAIAAAVIKADGDTLIPGAIKCPPIDPLSNSGPSKKPAEWHPPTEFRGDRYLLPPVIYPYAHPWSPVMVGKVFRDILAGLTDNEIKNKHAFDLDKFRTAFGGRLQRAANLYRTDPAAASRWVDALVDLLCFQQTLAKGERSPKAKATA